MIEQLRALPLKERIGQLFFIGIPGPEADDATRELLQKINPGGVCLFARNIREADQTRKLLDDIRDVSKVTPFLSIDQEGGLVDRLRRVMTPMSAANKMRNAADAERLAEIIAETLRILGFNMDFAPVVDVIDAERAKHTNGLFSREFGRSKEDVVAMAGAFLKTLQDNGVIGCVKHFPGLGAAKVDSHEELPQVDVSENELNEIDLYPYRELLATGEAKALMAAHTAFPRIELQETDQSGKLLPSSLSNNFINTLLRGTLGFDGLAITDDLEMGAIVKNYGIGDACKMAVGAGIDMLAICADPHAIREGHRAILDAVNSGELSEGRIDESLVRIAGLKSILAEPLEFNADRFGELSDEVAAFNEELSRDKGITRTYA
ncbi:MAG TPA: glycoside hydrolase family 3 N-terminal domain-containing protein [Pyrinomonadaceae bacterium]|nr:glycoside hydrolase family 3 N-terminal domain-containing protein [Pyrinomonadaceae bacterium]